MDESLDPRASFSEKQNSRRKREERAESREAAEAARAAALQLESENKRRARLAQQRRRGRRASILTGALGLLGEPALVDRPMARGAALLGESV